MEMNHCRLCAVEQMKSLDIFSLEGRTLDIAGVIAKHFQLEVSVINAQ